MLETKVEVLVHMRIQTGGPVVHIYVMTATRFRRAPHIMSLTYFIIVVLQVFLVQPIIIKSCLVTSSNFASIRITTILQIYIESEFFSILIGSIQNAREGFLRRSL